MPNARDVDNAIGKIDAPGAQSQDEMDEPREIGSGNFRKHRLPAYGDDWRVQPDEIRPSPDVGSGRVVPGRVFHQQRVWKRLEIINVWSRLKNDPWKVR